MYGSYILLAAPLAAFVAFLGMSSRPVPAERPIQGEKEEIRVMPVSPTPESNTVLLRIAVPRENEVISANPIWVQFRIDGYALGADSSQFPRADQVAVSDMGQTVHVIVDDRPYFAVNEPSLNPFNEAGYYYYQSYKFELPFSLKEGPHTLRMFPARSFGESLKGEGTFKSLSFYVGSNEKKNPVDFSKPFLTYNEPSEELILTEDKPVLLDFIVSNCDLTPDGYKIKMTIDGKIVRILTSWQPYYIYGLKKGNHTIRLELMNQSQKVGGSFNDVERTIKVR